MIIERTMTCSNCKFFVALTSDGRQGECGFNPPTAVIIQPRANPVLPRAVIPEPVPASFRPPVPGAYRACGQFKPFGQVIDVEATLEHAGPKHTQSPH